MKLKCKTFIIEYRKKQLENFLGLRITMKSFAIPIRVSVYLENLSSKILSIYRKL